MALMGLLRLEVFPFAVILSLPLSPQMAHSLFQDSPCITTSPSGSLDDALLRVTNDVQQPWDAREFIHEGRGSDLGCLMLRRNRSKTLIDNGKLDVDKSGYLISFRGGFLLIRRGTTFYVDPTGRIGSADSLCSARGFRKVSYENALLHWK